MINNLSCYSTFQCSLSKQRYGKKTFDWSNAFRVSCRHSKSVLKLRSLSISNLNHFIENFTEDAWFNANSWYTFTLWHLSIYMYRWLSLIQGGIITLIWNVSCRPDMTELIPQKVHNALNNTATQLVTVGSVM